MCSFFHLAFVLGIFECLTFQSTPAEQKDSPIPENKMELRRPGWIHAFVPKYMKQLLQLLIVTGIGL
jgi:hypothetical protein